MAYIVPHNPYPNRAIESARSAVQAALWRLQSTRSKQRLNTLLEEFTTKVRRTYPSLIEHEPMSFRMAVRLEQRRDAQEAARARGRRRGPKP